MAVDSLLIEAARDGNTAAVAARLEAGADINGTNSASDSALQWAAWNGHAAVVRLLIEKGANLDAASTSGSWKGCNAATLARKNSHPDVAIILEVAALEPSERWVDMGPTCVAREGVYPKLEKRLVQIFNFESRERLLMTENLRTKAECALPPTPFDALPQSLLEKALAEFSRFGGAADRDFVLHGDNPLGKPRKSLTQEK